MKLKNIIYTSALAAMILAAPGCSKEKYDINSNPDDVTDVSVTPATLNAPAQVATSSWIATEWQWLQMWLGYWARSGSYQSLTEIETYAFANNFQNGVWNNLYANANNYDLMINKAVATGAGFYEAIGRVMKSHNFQVLVDIYGNVPYSDAFKGTASPTPKYDKAIDIYKAIFDELDKALVLLANGNTAADADKNPDIATADLMYAGDRVAWRRFINTLRLRMIIHLHNGVNTTTVVPGIDVAAQMAKITADGYIGAGQSAHVNPGFSGSKPQPYYAAYNTSAAGSGSQRDHVRANEYSIEYLKVNGDLRINRFYVSPNGTTAGQTGITFGTPSGGSAPIGSALSTVRGPGYSPNGASSRAWILTSVESLFLQAEARQRGIITSGPSAAILLRDAIRESFVWLGLTSAQADTYIANNATWPDVDITAVGGGMYTILSQKWFALNGIAPYEAWTDYRRTDIVYGQLVGFDPGPPISVDPNNTKTKIPVRLFYPTIEFNYNAANVAAEGNIDVFNTRIFWDLN